MKIVLILGILLGAVLGVIAMLFIGGLFISRTHSATGSVKLAASRESVWAVITDHPGQVSWRKGLRAVERGEEINGHAVWREIDSRGRVMPIEIVSSDAPRRMVARIVDEGLPFGGTWTYELTPEGSGTRVRITEDGVIKPPPFRYIARLMGYDATLRGYLRALSAKFGENGAIEG